MKKVEYVVFRYLTNADFFNIYKPSHTESRGGGQTYIDFAVSSISHDNWHDFFEDVAGVNVTQASFGPRWDFPLVSLGIEQTQRLIIYQRRPQSFSIASQRIGSANSNRVFAWLPENGFPEPEDPANRQSKPDGLAVFLVKCDDNSVSAGWFQEDLPFSSLTTFNEMAMMENLENVEGLSGFIDLKNSNVFLDETNSRQPFSFIFDNETNQEYLIGINYVDEDELLDDFLAQDTNIPTGNWERRTRRRAQEVLVRNTKAVNALKSLYHGRCQITGDQYSFLKSNGEIYSEAHHLIPLGDEGADSPFNIIIVNPLIHRMLHYANVVGLDLSNITEENTLNFFINGCPYTITWHPNHAAIVRNR